MPVDTLTAFLREALRVFMIRSPMRTALGATGGVFGHVLLLFFEPLLKGVNLSEITDFRLAVSGIFIANLPSLFQRDRLPDAVEEQFTLVARAIKDGNLSQTQGKIYYAQIVTTVLENTKLSARAQREVDQLTQEATAERPARRSRNRATPS